MNVKNHKYYFISYIKYKRGYEFPQFDHTVTSKNPQSYIDDFQEKYECVCSILNYKEITKEEYETWGDE